MTNVVRHSQAQHVTVRLEFAADSFVLVVRDDGCGFDFEAHLARSGREHFGLLGIVERARILGGELRVASAPDAGAEVFCRIPYDARVASEESEDDVERGS
jgi:signal transduction histidine kinase